MRISGTFLDEISHDIPHQNWGRKEWDLDFQHMRQAGIDTVILIRCGYKRWMCYNSPYLQKEEMVYAPIDDLVSLFLDLSEKYNMKFYFGLYDSGKYAWEQNDYEKEADINRYVVDEVWDIYGEHPAFGGWYLSQEISRKHNGAIKYYQSLGRHCRQISDGLPILVSPYIDGSKALLSSEGSLRKQSVAIHDHEQEWDEILDGLSGVVDTIAFQDGQVDIHLLDQYLHLHKKLADKYGIASWSNVESFDRDMPIKFLPIKWEKLHKKMDAAKKAGVEKLITFEFSHFMSPQSSYPQARHLYNRYKEFIDGQS